MKHFLTAVLIFIVAFAQAQDFAPIGARWIYDSKPVYVDKYQFTSVKDTIIDGKVSRKIERVFYINTVIFTEEIITLNPFYLYQNADSVFYYNEEAQVFEKIYVFNVLKGDTITLDVPYTNDANGNKEFRIVIDSVATEEYGDVQLKKYKTRPLDEYGYGYDGAWYYDKVGSLSWFLPEGLINTMDGPGPLSCYKDDEISYPDASDCELPTGISKKLLQQMFTVYPNPAKDKIWIKSTLEIDKVEIYSNQGSLLNTSYSKEIKTGNLNSGRYLLKIYSGNDFVVKPVVVE